ncbi:hypothetical protein SASPL_125456 [Salvia splendens]|uniref:Dirigent protein n=1 Tax=Salvia splendens TaxID=180675 RepID=A0A8X8ZQS1_SALSN|nr:hypothetical protein SASPL_125456 [Salvia splendens]
MNARTKSLAMLLLLMFLSAGAAKGSNYIKTNHLFHKGEMGANSRKLLGIDIVLDYDDAGPNVKHDPRGRRGGKGP